MIRCQLCHLFALAAAMSFIARPGLGADDSEAAARKIFEASRCQGGIVVHLGCGDGRLTAALHAHDGITVHGLAANRNDLDAARRHVRQRKLAGLVSIELLAGKHLPYAGNLINLVVVEDGVDVDMDEVMRVLVPNGVVCFEREGEWTTRSKPRPKDIDDWSHFLHDASNNAVANDSMVGPPRSLQWMAPPLWLRSHETPSGIQSPVSANGRLFYFLDEGLIGITDERLPDRWSLVCRDAFNGKLLWKRPLGPWGWREWSRRNFEGKDWTQLRGRRTDVPPQNHRRIVADGGKLFVTLSYQAPMSIVDAATGNIVKTVAETKGTREILVDDGIALAYVQESSADIARRRGAEERLEARLVAADAVTGDVLWSEPCGLIRPLALAIQGGRVVYLAGKRLVARDLRKGNELWHIQPKFTNPKTLVAVDDVIVMQGGRSVFAHDAVDGTVLWSKKVPPIGGQEGEDLFVIDGLVWRGMASVDKALKPARKSAHALVVGWDLRTGEEKKRILVENLRSPEHHHRCYRNKATSRYMISSMEGAEFLDLQGSDHSQENWLRGACRSGMMPCNGMLYVPADQCFCEPGTKLLGYAALTGRRAGDNRPVENGKRLVKGPAYTARIERRAGADTDWPTFRHDPARRGSTSAVVPRSVAVRWRIALGGRLTAPVVAEKRLYVVQPDAHIVHAFDADGGQPLWSFTANGRIDSPPTVYQGLVLFGSADGRVYCLRATDGELVWSFLAAPRDRRIVSFDQLESSWPVHGSVLVESGVVYFTAGRSTYLDGGIFVYGLDPATGAIRYQTTLEGPFPSVDGQRDVSFYALGANSDVLVSEGGFLYMRQKKLTHELEEVKVDVLSNKGAQDVGLHIFSTSSLLDGSWYNRTFWMYSKRWPGFQLANQAPKTGQLLVVDNETTYALRVFYRRNVHSPMFFPGKEGYLLFADANTNEPQIVGEQGSRTPVKWLPQSDYSRARGKEVRKFESDAFGLDKMIGYTRAQPPLWTLWLPVRIRAIVKAGNRLYVAGAPDLLDPEDPYAAFEGRRGAKLVVVSASDGQKLYETDLESPPVFDGMIAAGRYLYAALRDGSVICLGATEQRP